jgi:hypothetical protein
MHAVVHILCKPTGGVHWYISPVQGHKCHRPVQHEAELSLVFYQSELTVVADTSTCSHSIFGDTVK